MRVPRRLRTIDRLERATRPRRPSIVATPLSGGPEGPEGKEGPQGKEGKAGANGEQGLTGTGTINCRLATAGALPAYTRAGNVLTANANGALPSIDGVAAAVNDFVLLTKGAAGADNGPFKITSLGSAGSKWTMERIPSMDTSAECVPGMLITVAEGSTFPDTTWRLTTDGPITLNTTALTFRPTAPTAGSTTVEMEAASTTSPYVKVTHKLGVKPVSVIPASNSEEEGIGAVWAEAKGITETQFEVRACRSAAPGKKFKIVIGWQANP